MHKAFEVELLLTDLPVKISAICVTHNRIYLGTATGILLLYEIETASAERIEEDEKRGGGAIQVRLLESKKQFAKKSIDQLQISKTLNCLVSRSDGMVTLHDLTTLTVKLVLSQAKGSHLFCVYHFVPSPSPSHQMITMVACATRKRLYLFTFRVASNPDLLDFPLPSPPRSLIFASSEVLFLSFLKEHVKLHIPSGQFSELLQAMQAQQSIIMTGANSVGAVVGGFGSGVVTVFGAIGGGLYGSGGGNIDYGSNAIRIPGGEILLGKESVSVYVNDEGQPSRKDAIQWSLAPEEVAFAYPYAIASLPKRVVEIRNIDTQSLVQTVDLVAKEKIIIAPLKHSEADDEESESRLTGSFYAAAADCVWFLKPVPIEDQIKELIEARQFSEAISVLSLNVETPIHEKNQQLYNIRTLHALYYFKTGSFDRAIHLFQDLETDPVVVIGLYPECVSGSLKSSDSQNLEGESLKDAVNVLIPYLTDFRTIASKQLVVLQQQSLSPTPPVISASPIFSNVSGTIPERRSSFNRSILVKPQKLDLNKLNFNEIVILLQNIDTTMLRMFVQFRVSMVRPFVRIQNWCRVEDCAKLLVETKRFKELVELYYTRGLHRKALQLLTKLGKMEDPDNHMSGVLDTIAYLQRLHTDHLDLIIEFSTWVLDEDPMKGLEIFTADLADVEQWPRLRVLDHLEQFSVELPIQYLEHVIGQLHDQHPELHTRLALLYLEHLQEGDDSTVNTKSSSKEKLLTFLASSKYYKAERVLSQLPPDDLFEERAIVLSRLGQHEKALHIYVRKLNKLEKAEEYCGTNPALYVLLFKTLLIPSHGVDSVVGAGGGEEVPLVEAAIGLLTRHGEHIDPFQALSALPDETTVQKCFDYLKKLIRKEQELTRTSHVVKGLVQAEHFNVEEDLLYAKAHVTKIEDQMACPYCHKRIGTRFYIFCTAKIGDCSVFAVTPDGSVVHYSCKERMAKSTS